MAKVVAEKLTVQAAVEGIPPDTLQVVAFVAAGEEVAVSVKLPVDD